MAAELTEVRHSTECLRQAHRNYGSRSQIHYSIVSAVGSRIPSQEPSRLEAVMLKHSCRSAHRLLNYSRSRIDKIPMHRLDEIKAPWLRVLRCRLTRYRTIYRRSFAMKKKQHQQYNSMINPAYW